MSGSLDFASTSDSVTVSLGGGNITAAFTIVLVVKMYGLDSFSNFTQDSAGTFNFGTGGFANPISLAWYNGSVASTSPAALLPLNQWAVIAVRKASGTSAPQFVYQPLPSGTPIVSNHATGRANKSASTGWKFSPTNGLQFLLAAAGFIKSVLTDAQIEGLTTFTAMQAIGFAELYRFDGSSPFNGSGTSTQTAISGTSHSTDEPTGFWGSTPTDNPLSISTTVTLTVDQPSRLVGKKLAQTTTLTTAIPRGVAKLWTPQTVFTTAPKKAIGKGFAGSVTFTASPLKNVLKPSAQTAATLTTALGKTVGLVRTQQVTVTTPRPGVAVAKTIEPGTTFTGSPLKAVAKKIGTSATFSASVVTNFLYRQAIATSVTFTAAVDSMVTPLVAARELFVGRREGVAQPDDLKNVGGDPH